MNYLSFAYSIDNFQSKYYTTIDKLVALPIIIPEVQRDLNIDRVNEISNYQIEFYRKNNTFGYIGELTLAKIDEQFIIIDGFHRYMSMKQIYLQHPSYIISLNIITPSSNLSINEIFTLINLNEPVPDYIIKTILDSNKRTILDEFSKLFLSEFKIYISKSKSPNRPNINLNELLDKLADSDIYKKVSSATEIFNYVKYINVNKWKMMDDKNSSRCLDKALKHCKSVLYITNDKDDEWMNNINWITEFINSLTFKKNNKIKLEDIQVKKKRKVLPKTIRLQVWTKYYPNSMQGYCKCCKKEIDFSNYNAGHIISIKNNGTDSIENLIPICFSCNNSCGGENMVDFCKKYNLPLEIPNYNSYI